MTNKLDTPYCTKFSANQGGLEYVYFSRHAGFVVTTQHQNNDMITRVRINTAGCLDSGVGVRSKQEGSVITVELCGKVSGCNRIADTETVIASDNYVNEYPVDIINNQQATPEFATLCNSQRMYRNWYQVDQISAEMMFRIPAGYKVDVSAEVYNGVATITFVQTIMQPLKKVTKWVDLTPNKFEELSCMKARKKECSPNDLITELAKKYNL